MGISQQIGASSLIKPGVCTSSTRPASPYEGQVIYETDTDKVLVWNGTAWYANWNLPWGLVDATSGGTSGKGYSTRTTNFTMTTTMADVTTMTVTWTAISGRLYRASFNGMGDNVGTAQFWIVHITDGSNVLQAERQQYMQAALPASIGVDRVFTGLTGSQTLKVRARTNTANSAIINGSTCFSFSVEDIGPA